MKNSVILNTALLLTSTSFVFAGDSSPACDAKRSAIEEQIVKAKSNDQFQEVAGLERALAANKANCSEESLAKERDEKIRDAQSEVASREKSLAEAERKGDSEKIAKRKAKLDEARNELIEAERPVGQ